MPRLGSTQQKIMLLLFSGLALGLSYSPKKHLRIIRGIGKEWGKINQQGLNRAVSALYRSRLIKETHHPDGTTSLILSKAGKQEALRFDLMNMVINKPKLWDKKWRLVLFDIPEPEKKLRDTFRWHLKQLGLFEFQKSVFIFPYDCRRELDFLIEYYDARKYVRYIVADSVDNALDIKRRFNLLS